MRVALRGRLMVGRLTLDQEVGVRVPAPQLERFAAIRHGHETPTMVALILWVTIGRRIAAGQLFVELALGFVAYLAVVGRARLARSQR